MLNVKALTITLANFQKYLSTFPQLFRKTEQSTRNYAAIIRHLTLYTGEANSEAGRGTISKLAWILH